jgi:hypothetical protein
MRLVTITLLLLSKLTFSAEEAKKVSLEDAKKYAVLHNFEVHSLKQNLEEMKAVVVLIFK